MLAPPGALLAPGAARAQNFPARPVRLIVPFAAGGPTDAIARMVAAQLEPAWGQPVTVENRPGAGGSTGSAVVARAAPDGLTLLVTANSHAINPAVLRQLPFDTLRDFTPVIRLADGPFVLVAHPALGVRDMAGFLALARARPGALNYATPGFGTGNHLSMERLKVLAGIDVTHVPFGGAAPASTALLGNQVQVMFNNMVNALPLIAEGRLVPLAIGSAGRAAVLPDLPSVGESFAGFTAVNWYAVFAPSGLPPAITATLNAAMARAVSTPAVAERLLAQGIIPSPGPAEAFSQDFAQEVAEWARVAQAAGIRPE
jgi:tripartite-type tricarboxylate transporter receptor subunit TctC